MTYKLYISKNESFIRIERRKLICNFAWVPVWLAIRRKMNKKWFNRNHRRGQLTLIKPQVCFSSLARNREVFLVLCNDLWCTTLSYQSCTQKNWRETKREKNRLPIKLHPTLTRNIFHESLGKECWDNENFGRMRLCAQNGQKRGDVLNLSLLL